MKILCIGDSLVRGTTGVDWIASLARRRPTWTIENAGKDGDTLTRIAHRLDICLTKSNDYQSIFLQAGINDILIPALAHKSWLFRAANKSLLRKGYHPIEDPIDFETTYREAISLIQERTSAQVILSTLACLNECPPAELNARRDAYNEIIRDIAWDMNCQLADVALRFDNALAGKLTRNYFIEHFCNTAWLDSIYCSLRDADALSRRRHLYLTIDGVHLNSRGAQLFRDEVDKELLKSRLYI